MHFSEKICPICQRKNQCEASSGCWCSRQKVPEQLINLLAKEQRGKSCICQQCVNAYHNDPKGFIDRHANKAI
ncbi:cysteine-rich CWC family protein [Vibrio sp. SCSIO 43137]|uniref:cysteine-rich CWC family protein n=1 Tax=Vibrio sp. SCSIO 43137 TaxID=3021011 RepID=UPI003FCEB9D3